MQKNTQISACAKLTKYAARSSAENWRKSLRTAFVSGAPLGSRQTPLSTVPKTRLQQITRAQSPIENLCKVRMRTANPCKKENYRGEEFLKIGVFQISELRQMNFCLHLTCNRHIRAPAVAKEQSLETLDPKSCRFGDVLSAKKFVRPLERQ